MKIDYIIPTLYRDTLDRSVSSIKQEGTNHNILICGQRKPKDYVGNPSDAVTNVNEGLSKIRIDSDWVIFLDDDDYLNKGFSKQLDNNFDIVVLRMSQDGSNPQYPPKVIPRRCSKCTETTSKGCCLHSGNVGINFAIKTSFYLKHKWLFTSSVKNPDWNFLERAINETNKIKVTKDIYYVAPMGGYYKSTVTGKR